MSSDQFGVTGIDHVELSVPDRYEAAAWYEDLLGLEIRDEYEMWADRGGPLMVASDDESTMLALFKGRPPEPDATVGPPLIAFGVDGDGFMTFLDRLEERSVVNSRGQPVGRDDVVDHGLASSIYFADPYGHRYEVTTYDRDFVRSKL
ncbi:VOC family protein [Natrinema ejinorense]|uniref:VOC domain-containing protein n=1 Tax=Natrinema ejinorense TaxID=373386 RepID=A0A2A5QQJ2_9EURY|nr:VOC family protein [Natrinema ejinorense]PCR89013.1 hypothetical protein CP557_21345 [Natrinema ejinorense]